MVISGIKSFDWVGYLHNLQCLRKILLNHRNAGCVIRQTIFKKKEIQAGLLLFDWITKIYKKCNLQNGHLQLKQQRLSKNSFVFIFSRSFSLEKSRL